jgi:hypothetical protein
MKEAEQQGLKITMDAAFVKSVFEENRNITFHW